MRKMAARIRQGWKMIPSLVAFVGGIHRPTGRLVQ